MFGEILKTLRDIPKVISGIAKWRKDRREKKDKTERLRLRDVIRDVLRE